MRMIALATYIISLACVAAGSVNFANGNSNSNSNSVPIITATTTATTAAVTAPSSLPLSQARQCPQLRCFPCASGLYRKDSNGCQTCACLQLAGPTAFTTGTVHTATTSIPTTATTTTTTTAFTATVPSSLPLSQGPQCPQVKCIPCSSGLYRKDSNGCQTCACLQPAGPTAFTTGTVNVATTATTTTTAAIPSSLPLSQAPQCPQVKCFPCPSGLYRKDSNGCQTCACLQPAGPTAFTTGTTATPIPIIYRSTPMATTPIPIVHRPTTMATPIPIVPVVPKAPLCGPVCFIYCEHGNVMNENGCPTCKCNPAATASTASTIPTTLITPTTPIDSSAPIAEPPVIAIFLGTVPPSVTTQPQDEVQGGAATFTTTAVHPHPHVIDTSVGTTAEATATAHPPVTMMIPIGTAGFLSVDDPIASPPVIAIPLVPSPSPTTSSILAVDPIIASPPVILPATASPPTIVFPVCGPICRMICPNGNVLDENGCPTCHCKPFSGEEVNVNEEEEVVPILQADSY